MDTCIAVHFILVQMKGKDGFNYKMILENLDAEADKFALAFISPNNTTDKYYVLPKKGRAGVIQLTLHKNPVSKNKYVFKLAP